MQNRIPGICLIVVFILFCLPLVSEAGRYNEQVVQGSFFKKYINADYLKKSAQESKDIRDFIKRIYNPELLLDPKDGKSFRLGNQTFLTVDDYNTSSTIKENITDKASYNLYCQEKGGIVYMWDEIGGISLIKGYVCEKDGLPESIQIRYSEPPGQYGNVYAHRYAYGTAEMFMKLANHFSYLKSGNGELSLETSGRGRFTVRVTISNKEKKPQTLSFSKPSMIVDDTEYSMELWKGADKTITVNPGMSYNSGFQKVAVPGVSLKDTSKIRIVFGSSAFENFIKCPTYERDKLKWSPQIDDLPKPVLR